MPSDEALLQQAENYKNKGNQAFATCHLDEAVTEYSHGIVTCDRLAVQSLVLLLKATLLSNRAMCYLKCYKLQPCIDDCTTALDTNKDSAAACLDAKLRTKLLYRRAKAHFLLANNDDNNNKNSTTKGNEVLLQEAAKDLLQVLQIDPQNSEATQLLQTVRNQHKMTTAAVNTPVAKTVANLRQNNSTSSDDNDNDKLHQLKLLLGLLDNDLANTAMELGRLDDAVIPLLLDLAKTNNSDKVAVLAMQVLCTAASHPVFVRQHLVQHQNDLLHAVIIDNSSSSSSKVVVLCLASLVRIILHSDRDQSSDEITGDTQLDYTCIVHAMVGALQKIQPQPSSSSPQEEDSKNNDDTVVLLLRAVLDVLSTFTAGHIDRNNAIRAALATGNGGGDPALPVPVTPQEIRAFTPQQLAAYKKRQSAITTRDDAWAYERALVFCSSSSSTNTNNSGLKQLLQVACACTNHVVRREVAVTVGRMLAALDDDDRIKHTVTPFLQDTTYRRRGDDEDMIEEVYNEDDDDDNNNNDEEKVEEVETTSLETKMERALITSALLLSRKELGAWALGTGWTNSDTELPDLIQSGDPRAMCLASEVLAAAATVETARAMVTSLISSGNMEKLMMSDDRDIRSGAASAVAKLGMSEKSSDEGEIMGLLQAACDLLEDRGGNEEGAASEAAATTTTKIESSSKKDLKHFSSFATSSVERAIEMLTYLIANTVVKEELAAGFSAHLDGPTTALDLLVQTADLPLAGESLSGFGLATIFQNMAATNEQIRKEAFEGKEVTMEQYDEMQRMGKTEEEKELMDQKKDTDTPAGCCERIRKMASANVPRALVALTEGASEHTLEQLVLAMNRMADEPSVRGIMIQQGILSACIKIEKNEGPTETDVMKKVIRLARHCIAKLLITTNPSLLTSAQCLGSVRPLVQLVRDIKASDLQHFEALLALTNIGSSGEDAKDRIVTEKGIPSFHFAMFSDHEMVRRAATEAMCNLVPHKAMMDHLAKDDNLRLWLAFAVDYEENYECARAATGCLAMATQDEIVAQEITKLTKFKPEMSALLESGRLEIMHRALCIVLNLVLHGPETRDKAIEAGLVAFCRAYIELQSHSNNELEFSEQERQLLPVTVDLAKKIVQNAD